MFRKLRTTADVLYSVHNVIKVFSVLVKWTEMNWSNYGMLSALSATYVHLKQIYMHIVWVLLVYFLIFCLDPTLLGEII
jgi:hypothetical protein